MSRGPCQPAANVIGGWQVTSWFGSRPDPITGAISNHGGMDLAFRGCHGASIYAPSSGTIAQGWDPSGGGWWSGITLDSDGSYCGIGHALEYEPPDAPSYRRVTAGELIARVDSSGGSTGDHVHVCYRPPGSFYYADPFDVLTECSDRFVDESMLTTTEDLAMIRNASDGGVYVLAMDMHGTLGWKLLNGDQATALNGLGFDDLPAVGVGDDRRDAYFAAFPIWA